MSGGTQSLFGLCFYLMRNEIQDWQPLLYWKATSWQVVSDIGDIFLALRKYVV